MTRQRRPRTHGLAGTTEHDIWVNMKQRCYNPNNPAYPRYGGRGILMDETWRNNFMAFYSYVGPRPSEYHSVDRIDNDRGYEPGNVRWATASDQSKNRRAYMVSDRRYFYEGEMLTIRSIAKRAGMAPSTIYKRLDNGWPTEIAFSAKPDPKFDTKSVSRNSL